ncbi:sensor histidine kinase [Luethyella okanaganae]|uniref:histidine kinase n=1 Tax=Luethyella okanaganae TaxID=69372 RepID=A0ABW1VFX9_9MICO
MLLRKLEGSQLAVDIVVGSLFLLLIGPITMVSTPRDGIVVLVLSTALSIRRLSPVLSLATAWLGAFLQMAFLSDLQAADMAILAVLYATGAYGERVVRMLGLISAGVGAVIAGAYLAILLPLVRSENPFGVNAMSTVLGFLLMIVAAIALLTLSWTLGLLARTRRASKESRQQQLEAQRQQERAQYAVVVEQERNRIARDMHDVVAHSLAVVIAQADGARYAAQNSPAVAGDALSTISSTAREALADVRLLLAELRHSEAEGPQPTIADLDRLVDQLRATGLTVEVRHEGLPVPLTAGHQIAVYRIVQEALTNALRHGDQNRPVMLDLVWRANGLHLVVSSAIAFPPRHPHAAGAGVGHGIPGMRERAALAGGTLTAGPTPQNRFEVIAWIPAVPGPAGGNA